MINQAFATDLNYSGYASAGHTDANPDELARWIGDTYTDDPQYKRWVYSASLEMAVALCMLNNGGTFETFSVAAQNGAISAEPAMMDTGYYVSVMPDAFKLGDGDYKQLPTILTADILARAVYHFQRQLSQPNTYLGVWRNGSNWYIEPSVHVTNRQDALMLAAECNQLAIWDIAKCSEIAVSKPKSHQF